MSYTWNWRIFWEPSPEGVGTYWTMLLQGLVTTLEVAVLAWIVALAVGCAMGVLRTVPNRLAQGVAAAWVELFRNIPPAGAVVPMVFRAAGGRASGGRGLAEVAAERAVPDCRRRHRLLHVGAGWRNRCAPGWPPCRGGRCWQGRRWGLTLPQTYRYVLLPMAFRVILPPLTSELVNTVKNTSVALTIGLAELTARARAMQEFSFQVFEAFTAATMGYLLVNLVATLLMRWLERRVRVPGYVGA